MPMSHRDLREKIRRETKGTRPEEEIRILEAYLQDWPEFKGPYQELRKKYEARLAELRRIVDVQAAHGAPRDPFAIRKRGLASVALLGLPNSGKSTLASSLSGVEVETADYPFTTLVPNVVMMTLGKVSFELIDLPPVSEEPLSALSYATGLKEAVMNATLLGLVFDMTSEPAAAIETLGLRLKELGVGAALAGEAGGDGSGRPRGAVVFASKRDLVGEREAEALGELLPGLALFEHPTGPATRVNIAEELCRLIGMMLVKARDPESPDEPLFYAVQQGASVRDLADRIHHALAGRAQRARVWGESASFAGQEVGLDHVLRPGDLVEIH